MSLVAALALALLSAPSARADYYVEQPPPAPLPRDDFWREVVAPHGDEINMILDKARLAIQYAANCMYQDCDAGGEQRARLYDEAYGMLRYARKLDPRQTQVLQLLGQVAEESGRPAAAVEAFQAYLAEEGPDATIPADVHMRLGRAYVRMGRWDDGIRQFRHGIVFGAAGGPQAACHAYLGAALMHTGRMADAIDVLRPAANLQNYWQAEPVQVLLSLAVAYDRDEQLNAAFEILDGLATQLTSAYLQNVQQALFQMTFVPAYDAHYYQGLFYESAGLLAEARTEWMIYASSEGAPYRGRALDHVAAIDRLQEDKVRAAAKAARDAAAAAKKQKKRGGKPPTPTPVPPTP